MSKICETAHVETEFMRPPRWFVFAVFGLFGKEGASPILSLISICPNYGVLPIRSTKPRIEVNGSDTVQTIACAACSRKLVHKIIKPSVRRPEFMYLNKSNPDWKNKEHAPMVLQVLDRRKGESLSRASRERELERKVGRGIKRIQLGKREGKDMSHWKAEQPEAAVKSQTPN